MRSGANRRSNLVSRRRGYRQQSLLSRYKSLFIGLPLVGVAAGIGFLMTRGGAGDLPEATGTLSEEPGMLDSQGREVILYFAGQDGAYLLPEKRVILSDSDQRVEAIRIMEALKRGPSQSDLAPTFPHGVTLRDVFLMADGCAVVDLDIEPTEAGLGGVSAEKLAIYSIVNSLTENLNAVETVRFLVQGKEVETLMGHLDARVLFRSNPHLVEEEMK